MFRKATIRKYKPIFSKQSSKLANKKFSKSSCTSYVQQDRVFHTTKCLVATRMDEATSKDDTRTYLRRKPRKSIINYLNSATKEPFYQLLGGDLSLLYHFFFSTSTMECLLHMRIYSTFMCEGDLYKVVRMGYKVEILRDKTSERETVLREWEATWPKGNQTVVEFMGNECSWV